MSGTPKILIIGANGQIGTELAEAHAGESFWNRSGMRAGSALATSPIHTQIQRCFSTTG